MATKGLDSHVLEYGMIPTIQAEHLDLIGNLTRFNNRYTKQYMMKRKILPMEAELEEMAKKVYVGKNDEEISGGSIRIGHLEGIIILNWVKIMSKLGEGYWKIDSAKQMRSWGFGLYDLLMLEQKGLIKIVKSGRSRYNVKIFLIGEISKI